MKRAGRRWGLGSDQFIHIEGREWGVGGVERWSVHASLKGITVTRTLV